MLPSETAGAPTPPPTAMLTLLADTTWAEALTFPFMLIATGIFVHLAFRAL